MTKKKLILIIALKMIKLKNVVLLFGKIWKNILKVIF